MTVFAKQDIQRAVDEYIATLDSSLWALNQQIHRNPELAYQEHHAHDAICEFLEAHDIPVARHAHGLSTAFEAIAGSESGRCVNFNAEYDALPNIGHACGHNLIATASLTGFMALAFLIRKFGLLGHAQLLGTPAEEDGGGKIDLIRKGAYDNVGVSLMMHPFSVDEFPDPNVVGIAGRASISCYDIVATFHGVSAHASASPWQGVNALDALVGAYNNISMLRQQLHPDERVHGAILQAPGITNAIPETTQTKYTVRSRTINRVKALGARVEKCLEAGALASGCELEIQSSQIFADLVVNKPLCKGFQECMADQGEQLLDLDKVLMSGSTDQGNVSQIMPALHALVGIPVRDGAKNHTRQFTTAAGTQEAHRQTITAGKALAMTGWMVLVDDEFYQNVKDDFVASKGTAL
ncbi:hypothetical protein FOPG_15082 [Fusarium oxysporum f. sp. conglutinans race 2 54008]|uniref:Peptidase M20 domain-containing protein 2 n=2 Tax=Fusarium oxysporum f. sp. conglutinans TaxID=100902 RepID=A0A8H6GLT1_FUSOX|nr:hypothetical protein FOPG_15082 [Fusarium oxysporum f. sp. conglutinans race 2 54008]KAF6519555.1 hypothetical protein HZS61_015972 [Fusarium oxysporum f. sp. conglutinans]KAG6995390.1 Peptidase M20 domain-containing protein 2 [Fusarium oxysporum f. sp. conglutinans]KAI8407759.1 hypothetical protein FOFC_13200 [Fusarium oxysporum]